MDYIKDLIHNNQDDFRPIPFWSWNDKLEKSLLSYQISQMKSQGMGGYFMHARGGLETEYLSEDWFECIGHCIKEGNRLNMQSWCYDENGWPSGFADGKVPSLGYEHHIKWLELRDNVQESNIVVSSGEYEGKSYYIVLCSNQYYVDTLSKNTIAEFIKCTHEKYYEKFADEFGSGIPGFFTDEPQYRIGKAPWSLDFADSFEDEYGYSIIDKLICLFKQENGYQKLRNDYWKLVAKRFRNALGFMPYDWCNKHNVQMTGHVMHEDSLYSQMESTAGSMGFYEYLHIPGMDWLTRSIASPIIPKQVSSAAMQLGRKRVLSEMFALCGWDVSFNDLKWIAEWQFVNGINLICQHLESYTIRGFRKRDFPASLFVQQPWWDKYYKFNDYFSKLGALLANGEDVTHTLLLHPINSAYVAYDMTRNDSFMELDNSFLYATNLLSDNRINYHYGDEYLMSKYASVSGNKLLVGECSYDKVVIPKIYNISRSTLNLLVEYIKNGGIAYALCDVSPLVDGEYSEEAKKLFKSIKVIGNEVNEYLTDEFTIYITQNGKNCNDIHSTCRIVDGKPIWFVVNHNKDKSYNTKVSFNRVGNYGQVLLDCVEYQPIANGTDSFNLTFNPTQSYILTLGENKATDSPIKYVRYPDEFEYSLESPNAITLDCCEYKIDDGEWKNKRPLIEIQQELMALQKNLDVSMRFTFDIKGNVSSFNQFELVTECPEQCEIIFNGKKIENICKGEYIDSTFKRISIENYIVKGKNELIINRNFYQRQKVYDVLYGKDVFETERNKLTYDTELESVYIIGDFGVYCDNEQEDTINDAFWIYEPFYIDTLPKTLKKDSLTRQGFMFFSGKIDLNFDYLVDNLNCKHIIDTSNIHSVVAGVTVNSKEELLSAFEPYSVEISDYIKLGKNNIKLTLYSGLRNLLGPHHNRDGECLCVSPHSFGCTDEEAKRYCFVNFGLKKE